MLILHSRYRGIKGKIQGNNWEKMLISHSRYRGIKRYRGIILKNVAIVHWFQCCPPGWVTCIATLPGIALLALSVGIDLVSSSARVTSVKSNQTLLTHSRTTGPNYRTPGLPGSDKKYLQTFQSVLFCDFRPGNC